MTPEEQHIEREIQRGIARQTQQISQELEAERDKNAQLRDGLMRQHAIINKLTGSAVKFGTLIRHQKYVQSECFEVNAEIIVVDRNSQHFDKGGVITSLVDDQGYVNVKLTDNTEARFSVGLEGKDPAQVRLTSGNDGTRAVISVDGKPWEIQGSPDEELELGDPIKINTEQQIVGRGYDDLCSGKISRVASVHSDGVEIYGKQDNNFVQNPKGLELEEGDRVVTDESQLVVLRKLPEESSKRYTLSNEMKASWDDVGGLEWPKQQLKEAIEFPYQRPDLYEHYKVKVDRGVLLYGPPGNGKTLLARVAAWAMAELHGKEAVDSGYIYVKGPELLNMWVGNTEAEVRYLFDKGRKHYRKHGYKAILVIEEAEALLAVRGMKVSGINDTIVPMFLVEMDGVDEQQTKENPVIFLLTNRPDIIDPAITRPGRITKHIKVNRPDEITAIEILQLKIGEVPMGDDPLRTFSLVVSDLYSKSRILYRINNEHDFTLGDTVSGATLETLAERAKLNAIRRDMETGSLSSVTPDDFRAAINMIEEEQRGLNHKYDLEDFADRIGIRHEQMQVERCHATA